MRITITPCVASLAMALALAISGCAQFEPRAMAPAAAVAAYEARTLDSAELHAFIQQNTRREPGSWPPAQWDLELLTLAAFYYHPDLDVARAKWSVAQAASQTAGMRPNPALNVNAQQTPSAPGGTSPWTLGLNLDIPIETAGKRGYRVKQANQLSEAARLAIASTAWQVRSRVRGVLLDLQIAAQTREALRQQQRWQQESVGLLERRLALGMASTPEVTQARITLAQNTLALGDSERLLSGARTRLAGALGLSSKALEQVELSPPSLTDFGVLPADELRAQALLQRPDTLAALAEYAASQSALQLAVANQYPDVHLGPGYTWDQGVKKWSLGLSLVIPLMNQNQGPIAEAKAKRAQAAAAFNATQARAIGEIEAALAGYRASRDKLVAVEGLATAQNDQLRRAEALFKAGETDRAALLGARLELSQTALARVDALAKAQQAWGALEDAAQSPLMTPGLLANAIQNNARQSKENSQ